MARTRYMDPAALPPMPDPETGLPRPPHAPGRASARPARLDPDRAGDPALAPAPPPGQGPVLAWYRASRRCAVMTGFWGFVLTAFLLTLRDAFQFHWVHYWWAWLSLLAIGFLVGLSQLKGTHCAAGAEWVQGRKSWVRTYELVKVKSGRSASGVDVAMRDSAGRELSLSLATLQQDRLLWDLVYNGILHSVIAGDAETNGRIHLHLNLPYRSPYSS
ncbi:MAG TPA: hypothetical protein VGD84_09240 [Pseudonocardiaceae bacterium]